MKSTLFMATLLATTISFASCNNSTAKPIKRIHTEQPKKEDNNKIQVALLLDTSNSMDGLIDQAKSRLWNIVNTLTTLKYSGKTPDIEIALYEYGNDGLAQQSNYIRQVTPLTTDLDLISEKLFALKTNGGNEYCGAVIQDATKKLQWGKENNNMKLI
jgi:nitric oxide reductase activation protein